MKKEQVEFMNLEGINVLNCDTKFQVKMISFSLLEEQDETTDIDLLDHIDYLEEEFKCSVLNGYRLIHQRCTVSTSQKSINLMQPGILI